VPRTHEFASVRSFLLPLVLANEGSSTARSSIFVAIELQIVSRSRDEAGCGNTVAFVRAMVLATKGMERTRTRRSGRHKSRQNCYVCRTADHRVADGNDLGPSHAGTRRRGTWVVQPAATLGQLRHAVPGFADLPDAWCRVETLVSSSPTPDRRHRSQIDPERRGGRTSCRREVRSGPDARILPHHQLAFRHRVRLLAHRLSDCS